MVRFNYDQRELSRSRQQMDEIIGRLDNQEESLRVTFGYGVNLSELSLMLKLSKAIKANTTLQSIELFSNKIGDLGIEILTTALTGNAYLRNADIQVRLLNCKIGETGARHLAKLMKTNRGIEELDIGNNKIGDSGLMYIVGSLENHPNLTTLDLADNNIWRTGASALGKVLKTNSHILTLDLDENPIGHAGVKQIAYSLEYNSTLVHLNLNGCSIADVGASYLARGLRFNSTLRIIVLKNNGITSKGGKALATMIRKNRTLEEIYLCSNKIDDKATEYFAQALKVNNTLSYISLRRNKIGDQGAENLARMIPFNRNLMTLNLRYNDIGNRGASYLVKALMLNSSLIRLNLMYNQNTTSDADWNGMKYEKLEANDKKRKKLFLAILNSDKKNSWKCSTLAVTGLPRAGKSSTVRSLLNKSFNELWSPTEGMKISECEVSKSNCWKHCRENENKYSSRFAMRILIQDKQYCAYPVAIPSNDTESDSGLIGGSERHTSISTSVADKDLEMNSETAAESSKQTQEPASGEDDINEHRPTIIDKENDTQLTKLLGNFDEDEYMNVKRQVDGHHFRIMDRGGQSTSDSTRNISTHSTPAGMYLLIFDLRQFRDQDTEAMRSVSVLLKSIKSCAPAARILLVGTFMADINQEKELSLVNKAITQLLNADHNNSQIVHNTDEQLSFFPIDNKGSLGIPNVRKKIERIVHKDKSLRKQVSMKWIALLDLILSKKSDSVSYLSFLEVKDLAKAHVGINCSVELEEALKLFHNRGMISYVTSTEAVKGLVILDPQWLLDSISKIVRHDGFLYDFNRNEIDNIGLADDLRMLSEKALVSRDFLEYVWDKGEVDFLLDYLKITMFLSEWNVHKGDESWFLIPCLLRNTYEKKIDGLKCIFDFSKGFLSSEIFHRLTCLIVSYCSEYRSKYGDVAECLVDFNPELYRNFASIACVPGFQFQLLYDSDLNRIIAFIENKTFAARTLHVIQAMLLKAKSDTVIMGAGTGWEILLENDITSDLIGYSDARKQLLLPWFDDVNRAFGSGNGSLNVDLNTLF